MFGKKVIVFGGTSYIGRAIINELSNAGYETTFVVRRSERYREFALYPNTKVKSLDSLSNKAALAELMQGQDILINLLADRATGTEMIAQKELIDCAKYLHGAMESVHTSRALTLSYLGASHDADADSWQGVLADFETQMLNIPNLNSTVFRAGLLFGEGDDTTTPFMKQLQRMPVLMMANSRVTVQPLWVKDFAKAFVNSINNKSQASKKINIAGETQMSLKALGSLVAELMEEEDAIVFPMCKINAKINATLGFIAPIVSVTKSQLATIRGDAVTDVSFEEQFGFKPASMEWVIAHYVQPTHLKERYNDYRKYAQRD